MKTQNSSCPICRVAYAVVQTNFQSRGVIVKDVDAFVCPKCGREVFSWEQAGEIEKRIEALAPRVPAAERKISSAAGKKPVMYLPEKALQAVGLAIGDRVLVTVKGKSIVLLPV